MSIFEVDEQSADRHRANRFWGLGRLTFKTPLLKLAATLSSSTVSGTPNDRQKLP
jgi:hypothetical protein